MNATFTIVKKATTTKDESAAPSIPILSIKISFKKYTERAVP